LNVIVVGASGYSGLELIRILSQHPNVEIAHLFAHSQEYDSILEIYPHLNKILDIPVKKLDDLNEATLSELRAEAEIVFLATPSGVSKEWGPIFFEQGFKVIDLSGDFRLKNPSEYQDWYRLDAPDQGLVDKAVYGLAEWFPKEIAEAQYIANPGCYATSILLALAPIYHNPNLHVNSLIIDAKSGVSGAGRGYSKSTHFSETNDNFKAYKVGKHQHIPEIEQVLGQIHGKELEPTQMITHLLPITRGILSTIYIQLEEDLSYEEIMKLYKLHYQEQPFIRLRAKGDFPETKHVYGTNFCDIGFYKDERTNRFIIFSVIDNLVKGAAGQAVQNLNLMMGWNQALGLNFVPIYP